MGYLLSTRFPVRVGWDVTECLGKQQGCFSDMHNFTLYLLQNMRIFPSMDV